MRRRLGEEWESYRREVVPADASAVQLQECRRAFYAGAQALMGVMLSDVSPGDGMTAEDVELVAGVDAELREFQAAVLAGEDGGG